MNDMLEREKNEVDFFHPQISNVNQAAELKPSRAIPDFGTPPDIEFMSAVVLIAHIVDASIGIPNKQQFFEDLLLTTYREFFPNLNISTDDAQALIDIRDIHYNRNMYQSETSLSYEEVILGAGSKYALLGDGASTFHRLNLGNDVGNDNNAKWVTIDGLSEFVFKATLSGFELVISALNYGTYNFRPPTDANGHMVLDVIPWLLWGNSSIDEGSYTLQERSSLFLIDGGQDKVIDRDVLFKLQEGDSETNTLFADSGNNYFRGWEGDDVMIAGEETDFFFGGIGIDTVSYINTNTGITVNLGDSTAQFTEITVLDEGVPFLVDYGLNFTGQGYDGYARGDQFYSIENITGSDFGDIIVGDRYANLFRGLDGNDSLYGQGGDDALWGGQGNDRLDGGLGIDTAHFLGTYSQYTIVTTVEGALSIISNNTSELGTDSLRNIEILQFSDLVVNVSRAYGTSTPTAYLLEDATQINTYSDNDQSQPAVIHLEGGGYVVLWNSYIYRNSGQYAQIFDSSHNKIGEEFRVNTTDQIERETAISSLADGGFVVAWFEYHRDGDPNTADESAVISQQFDASGNRVGAEIEISLDVDIRKEDIVVTGTHDGGYVTAWIDSNYDIGTGVYTQDGLFLRIKNPSTEVLGDVMQIADADSGVLHHPTITQLNAGNILITWASSDGLYEHGTINGRIINNQGEFVGGVFSTTTPSSRHGGHQHAVTELDNGNFVIAWDSEFGTTASIFSPTGDVVLEEFYLGDGEYRYEGEVDLAVLSDGTFIVVWMYSEVINYTNFPEIRAQRFDENGVKIGETFVAFESLSSSSEYVTGIPSVASIGDGEFVVVTTIANGADGDDEGIFSRVFSVRDGEVADRFELNLSSGNDIITTGDESNTIFGDTGDDVIDGGGGGDSLDGGIGSDTISFESSDAGIIINLQNQTASGGHADGVSFVNFENVLGSVYFDSIVGDLSINRLEGGDGNDTLEGLGGSDTLDGGEGFDTAIYTNSTNRVVVNLLADTASGAQATGDVLISIENLTGSNFGDDLSGDNGINVLTGNGGRDVLIGFNGEDALYGGAGRDILNGGDGADIIDGGAGVDQARYNGSTLAVQVDLLAGTATGGQAQGDTLISIENLFGSNHNDTLYGDGNNNKIFGHNGNDALAAGGGVSKLYGGAGSDSFVLSDGFAFVMDFVDDVDQLDVSDYGFATLSEALMNLDQVGGHARFRFDGDVLFVLNTDMNDLTNDIVI